MGIGERRERINKPGNRVGTGSFPLPVKGVSGSLGLMESVMLCFLFPFSPSLFSPLYLFLIRGKRITINGGFRTGENFAQVMVLLIVKEGGKFRGFFFLLFSSLCSRYPRACM